MKKIEAIIRKTKFEDVKDALLEADIEWFSYYDVRGIGKARQGRIYRGVVYDTSSIERILVSIVVREKNVEKTVQAIIKAAHTGEIGDGRIFVIPIEDAVRIRTGERGDIALYNAEQETSGKHEMLRKISVYGKHEKVVAYTEKDDIRKHTERPVNKCLDQPAFPTGQSKFFGNWFVSFP